MRKTLFSATAIVSLVVMTAGLSLAAPANAETSSVFHVQMGASSSDMSRMAMAFYPADIAIHRMDVVVFTSPGAEIHTVAFGAPSDLYLNVFDYFVPYGGTVFNGNPLNSGELSADSPFGNTIALTFDVPPGTYAFRCGFHPLMRGTVTIVPDGQPLPYTDAQYAEKAHGQMTSDLAKARGVATQSSVAAMHASDIGGNGIEVAAGGSSGVSTVMRFFPSQLKIHAGDTVTFVNRDPYAPHTITFGPEPDGAPLSLVAPYGDPAHFDGTSPLNSGFLYPVLPFGMSFSVTFTAPGTYGYICGLHDVMGMVGSVTVVA